MSHSGAGIHGNSVDTIRLLDTLPLEDRSPMSISKVAKLAGVSSSTVSRVINNHPRVAPDTALSVRRAMQELGYTPSETRPGPKPQSRSRKESPEIAFLVLGTSRSRATPAFQDLLRGVSMAATSNDLNLIFHHVSDPT